jgi:hypothetical protein
MFGLLVDQAGEAYAAHVPRRRPRTGGSFLGSLRAVPDRPDPATWSLLDGREPPVRDVGVDRPTTSSGATPKD